ncbi:MAG: hemopexin repeat-containing protein, partial [Actinomycetota bacterium]|nr:hemopexin repeat-containing protein [Actinomycetota bacterium]
SSDMADRIVDAAFSDGDTTATFFLADQYVRYDYVTDRVLDGVHPLSSFPPGSASGFPDSFAPAGPGTSVDAALRGKHAFDGRLYFFRGTDYVRFVAGGFDPPFSRPVAGNWGVPDTFTRFDAAFNGALNRDRFCYLFQGAEYTRYVWADDRADAGYPKPISNMVGMPADFAAGVDAAVDGAAQFADASYLFLGDRYLRFQWVADGEPHVDGVRSIQDGWPGLAELLLAAKAKSQALSWVRTARARVMAQQSGILGGVDAAVLAAAVTTHFHTTVSDSASLTAIDATMARVESTLVHSPTTLRFRTDAQAIADGVPNVDAAYTHPWPPGPGTGINVTRNFTRRTERNRASSLIHEAVHVNDAASATPSTHINEWYVSPAQAPALGLVPIPADLPEFATRYDLMSTSDALHNPASYATFARHLAFGIDNRENP